MTFQNISLFLAALATALAAGLFYSYSCSVNPGLARLGDREYLMAMQHINRAILNPVFFASFLGALVLLPLSAWGSYTTPVSLRFWLLVCAAVVYAVGLFGVTMFGNVPLNEMLDGFVLENATPADLAAKRLAFEGPWNFWHLIRTISVVMSLALILAACIMDQEKAA